ncbi:M24 family metallopeptidase, partial [candidate division KSB1 bacterium]|nr:M24 family metallopeptidase [candidate division KSB1 bacterium]NIS26588.1 M24 family metallopeptidase [candidate division KSB1 bacterium]NIU27200.1 M24 family metallopeptidase [candidate division KSB1 bacterium]NIU93443.1 M24 family metallopeptidase [candidate division KSB1 bacterium]NIV94419.1 M24 family metallopeptidase [candidate division KSB1 bacterium]
AKIGEAVRNGQEVTEYEIQQFIVRRFDEEGLTCEGHNPIVGINEHPANPHFEPTPENSYTFEEGNSVLIDLWAKKKALGSIYYDVTWCGYVGDNPPPKYQEIFNTVRDARKAALNFVKDKFAQNEPCYGWQVDEVCRNVIEKAGYGEYFVHRTGHSIGTNVHGNGVNMDNLETKDERQLVPGVCFSIEPGIYIDGEMAARSEINVFITPDGEAEVYGDQQEDLILVR